jgi:hypothetical protein
MITTTADEEEARQLRAAMVDSLRPATPISDRVSDAMRAVPREQFLPDVPLSPLNLEIWLAGLGSLTASSIAALTKTSPATRQGGSVAVLNDIDNSATG